MSLDVNISEPEEFNHVELHKYIEEFTKLRGIEEFQYHVDNLCGRSDNFISNLFRVLIKDTSEDGNRDTSVIVKTLVNTVRQELFNKLHEREVLAYTVVFEKFKELQNDLPEEKKIYLPECYLSNTEKGKEVMLIEDLKASGFEMEASLENFEIVHYKHLSAGVIELAKFHALSFVLQHKEPQVYELYQSQFQDLIFSDKFLDKTKLRSHFQDSFATSVNVVYDSAIKLKLEKLESNLLYRFKCFVKPGKHNVLCHGDCWINNVLFKHNDEGNPTKVCLIDFQALRFANPVTDIVYLIYLCTDSQFRIKHFVDLQEDYYNNLKTQLSLYDMDVDCVYPKADFEKDIEDYLAFGLLSSLVELRTVTKTTEEDAILKGSSLIGNSSLNEVPGENNLFIYRVNDVVDEFIANGVLDKILGD